MKKYIPILALVLVAFVIGFVFSQQNDDAKPTSYTDEQDTTSTPAANGKSLDLSGQQLTSLADSVLAQTNITELNLSNNQLTSLPAGITKLTNLEVLNVENNRLTTLPAEISQLTKLREIHANNNRMESLPMELGDMTWLKLLDVSGNNIPEEQIEQLKAKLPDTTVKS